MSLSPERSIAHEKTANSTGEGALSHIEQPDQTYDLLSYFRKLAGYVIQNFKPLSAAGRITFRNNTAQCWQQEWGSLGPRSARSLRAKALWQKAELHMQGSLAMRENR
ncbi:MAG TPA: hypothetical protein VM715_21095 [Candidatus Acidoferrum sp.]|jgi:hypothetical protein|nr:hypothetical protein [Candidatus Acidoferrum sp.]